MININGQKGAKYIMDLSFFDTGVCSECGRPVSLSDKNYEERGGKYICADCVDTPLEEKDSINQLRPKQIYEMLDKKVYGQNRAKMILSNAGYLHLKRISGEIEGIDKSNVMLVGKSGSGKTFLVKTLANILGVPFISVSATSLTENGYVGADVESCIRRLVDAAGNRKMAEKGIIFIDEIDKLSANSSRTASGSVVIGREGVQQALLKLIEGDKVSVSEGSRTLIDTSNILFICAGAFDGIENIIEKRQSRNNYMGFMGSVGREVSDIKNLTNDDLFEYGMIREFIGRFPNLVVTDDVDEDFLCHVLRLEDSVLEQYRKIFENEDVEIVVNDELLHYIAYQAVAMKTGCRGLRSVCDQLFEKALFNIDEIKGKKLLIQGGNGNHEYILLEQQKCKTRARG